MDVPTGVLISFGDDSTTQAAATSGAANKTQPQAPPRRPRKTRSVSTPNKVRPPLPSKPIVAGKVISPTNRPQSMPVSPCDSTDIQENEAAISEQGTDSSVNDTPTTNVSKLIQLSIIMMMFTVQFISFDYRVSRRID